MQTQIGQQLLIMNIVQFRDRLKFYNNFVVNDDIRTQIHSEIMTIIDYRYLYLRLCPKSLFAELILQNFLIYTLQQPWPQAIIDIEYGTYNLISQLILCHFSP